MSIGRHYRCSAIGSCSETEPGAIRRGNLSDDRTHRSACRTPVRNSAENRRQKRNDGHRPIHYLALSRFGDGLATCCWCPASLGNPSQLGCQIAGILPAFLRVLGQTPSHDSFQRDWRQRLQSAEGFRVLLQNRARYRELALARERPLARQHLVERCAKCEQVAPGIRLVSLNLLRTHILHRAHYRACRRDR